ncbi:hypothetical protein AYI70_g1864 [Smittium culicis]|uniref:Uncharacterized protein n=1 Tax=Smittium culicis TaxID=133412 RepID=A0A1R1YAW6_9FUNG|nr:hypothetical protein AYI70_g1864 [Smittium culicis]
MATRSRKTGHIFPHKQWTNDEFLALFEWLTIPENRASWNSSRVGSAELLSKYVCEKVKDSDRGVRQIEHKVRDLYKRYIEVKKYKQDALKNGLNEADMKTPSGGTRRPFQWFSQCESVFGDTIKPELSMSFSESATSQKDESLNSKDMLVDSQTSDTDESAKKSNKRHSTSVTLNAATKRKISPTLKLAPSTIPKSSLSSTKSIINYKQIYPYKSRIKSENKLNESNMSIDKLLINSDKKKRNSKHSFVAYSFSNSTVGTSAKPTQTPKKTLNYEFINNIITFDKDGNQKKTKSYKSTAASKNISTAPDSRSSDPKPEAIAPNAESNVSVLKNLDFYEVTSTTEASSKQKKSPQKNPIVFAKFSQPKTEPLVHNKSTTPLNSLPLTDKKNQNTSSSNPNSDVSSTNFASSSSFHPSNRDTYNANQNQSTVNTNSNFLQRDERFAILRNKFNFNDTTSLAQRSYHSRFEPKSSPGKYSGLPSKDIYDRFQTDPIPDMEHGNTRQFQSPNIGSVSNPAAFSDGSSIKTPNSEPRTRPSNQKHPFTSNYDSAQDRDPLFYNFDINSVQNTQISSRPTTKGQETNQPLSFAPKTSNYQNSAPVLDDNLSREITFKVQSILNEFLSTFSQNFEYMRQNQKSSPINNQYELERYKIDIDYCLKQAQLLDKQRDRDEMQKQRQWELEKISISNQQALKYEEIRSKTRVDELRLELKILESKIKLASIKK